MQRGLALSIVVHLAVLGLLATWGGLAPTPSLEPQRVLKVKLAHMPHAKPQVQQPAAEPQTVVTEAEVAPPEIEAEPDEVEPAPPPPPIDDPVLPDKNVPEIAEDPPEAEPDREPEPLAPAEVPEIASPIPDEMAVTETDIDSAAVVRPLTQGPAASGTDVDFPFAWYLKRVEGNVARKWQPRQLGFRGQSQRQCVVHFMIGRTGTVSQVSLIKSSGVSLFDREALRAVKASRVPPLPGKFSYPALGVTFVFTLQSGV